MEQLLRKIEAIRKEPEHVRMRYVFLSVAVSMIFVILLWMFSVYEGFRSAKTSPSIIPSGMNLPKAPSIDDFSQERGRTPDGELFFQSERLKDTGSSKSTE